MIRRQSQSVRGTGGLIDAYQRVSMYVCIHMGLWECFRELRYIAISFLFRYTYTYPS